QRISAGELGVEPDCLPCGHLLLYIRGLHDAAGFLKFVASGSNQPRGNQIVAGSQSHPGGSEIGLARHDAFKHLDGLIDREGAQKRESLKIVLVGVEIAGAVGNEELAQLQAQGYSQRARNRSRDLLLDREDIGELTVVVLRPEM